MSLIGVDVGSSSVKACAFSEEGVLLAEGSHPIHGSHPQPGTWEQDPNDVWEATMYALRQLAAHEAVRHDSPRALAISASGRENFLADLDGNPLAPAVMGADTRGAEFEIPPEGTPLPEAWSLTAGHLRERMDPVFRLLWWRKYHPALVRQAAYFLGWHDFLTLRLCGTSATDPSTASRYAVYDLTTLQWSPERVAEHQISAQHLPQIPAWGTTLGKILPDIADDLGLPAHLDVVLGGHDVNCAALGAGVTEAGEACLISGSYENVLIMSSGLPTPAMLLRGLSVMPHPGTAGYSTLAVCPTGNAVLNWARGVVNLPLAAVEAQIPARTQPSPVLALPYLSGSMTYWQDGRQAKGALLGITLATTPLDIVQAFMESIAYDHVNTFALLAAEGVSITRIRAVGGGTRSRWWTQLKADMTGIPIEVVEQQEAGTLGAAILAGVGIGLYDDIAAVSRAFAGTRHVYIPDGQRAALHSKRIGAFSELVPTLIDGIYADWV